MESSADRDSYWTPAEVATWIQTRDVRRVEGIKDPTRLLAVTDESTPVLEDLPKRCRNGRVCVVGRRCNYYDSAFKRSEPIGGPLLWRSPRDGQPSDLAEKIPPHDWIDLTWEPPVNGKVTGNLYSKSRRRRAWEMVQFARSDVMREWPCTESSVTTKYTVVSPLWRRGHRRVYAKPASVAAVAAQPLARSTAMLFPIAPFSLK